MSRVSENLVEKVCEAVQDETFEEVVTVLTAALGIAINGNYETRQERLVAIEHVTNYLLEKSEGD